MFLRRTAITNIARLPVLLSTILLCDTAQAQATDDFDVSATTGSAATIVCSQNLSFGRVYIGPSNSLAVVTLTSGGSLSSDQASVVASGAAIGLCTISGLQSPDSAIVFISGGGTSATGGVSGVTLSDGASHTLTATVQIGGSGFAVVGGRIGMGNGAFPVFGTVTIPASHTNFGAYTATLNAMIFLN